jgi:hypothetical protein
MLPFVRGVIFVDWHGVLSRDPFWTSILTSPRHPVQSALKAKLGEIFSRDEPTAHDWMRGFHSSADIISTMAIDLPGRYGPRYLQERLYLDCRRMNVNVELFEILRYYRPEALVVLATDNMDCFVHAFGQARSHRSRSSPPPDSFAAWATYCDDLVCSSDVGTLKNEDPETFFGPWLADHGLTFADALLIDDRADNCDAFARHGGSALQWKMGADPVSRVQQLLGGWLTDRVRLQG